MRLAILVLAATFAASAPAAQSSGGGILVVSPAPRLAIDAGLGERAESLVEPAGAGPRARGAWRGAKRGFLVGLAIGAAGTVAAFVLADGGDTRCEYICNSAIAAILTVPLVAVTTTAGAVIGATNAGGPIPIRTP